MWLRGVTQKLNESCLAVLDMRNAEAYLGCDFGRWKSGPAWVHVQGGFHRPISPQKSGQGRGVNLHLHLHRKRTIVLFGELVLE